MKAFFYTLIGYYIENNINVEKLKRKELFGIILMTLTGIFLSCACTYYQGTTSGSYTQNYVQLFDYLTTMSAFILIKYLVLRGFPKLFKGRFASAVCTVGSLTFGIYLLDTYLKLVLYSRYEAFAEPFLPTLLVSFGWCAISMILGGLITFVLKKMPLFSKLL